MRRAWLAHVAKIRKRENRGKSECSYREAMKRASTSWPDEKRKHERRLKREAKVNHTQATKKPLTPPQHHAQERLSRVVSKMTRFQLNQIFVKTVPVPELRVI